MATSKGSCLCGNVRYEIEGEFESFFMCHCSRCRKGSGTAHGANLFSTSASLKWLGDSEAVKQSIKTFQLPNTMHTRSFCTECGSLVPSLQMEGKLLVVPAGGLDTEISIKPNAHICMDAKANWDTDLENVTKLDGMPTG